MLQIQNFLRQGGTPEQLKVNLGINAKIDSEFPNLILFKYNQIESPMSDPIVQESRGIILDSANNWEVISRPYDKFFNHGEGHAASIDWASARVLEKLDGSCIQMYWYNGAWRVGTLGVPNANCQVGNLSDKTFSELFWSTFRFNEMRVPDPIYKGKTFIFELMTPYNRVVVPHKDFKLVLHGIRNTNGVEVDLFGVTEFINYITFKQGLNWQIVKSYPLGSIDEILSAAGEIDPMQSEGFVVVDKNFKRVKIKSPAYVALHHAVDGFSKKAFLEIIRSGEMSEFLIHFPEFQNEYNQLTYKYHDLIGKTLADYEKYKHIADQKEFALAISKLPYASILFSMRSGKVDSITNAYKVMHIDRLLMLMDKV